MEGLKAKTLGDRFESEILPSLAEIFALKGLLNSSLVSQGTGQVKDRQRWILR